MEDGPIYYAIVVTLASIIAILSWVQTAYVLSNNPPKFDCNSALSLFISVLIALLVVVRAKAILKKS